MGGLAFENAVYLHPLWKSSNRKPLQKPHYFPRWVLQLLEGQGLSASGDKDKKESFSQTRRNFKEPREHLLSVPRKATFLPTCLWPEIRNSHRYGGISLTLWILTCMYMCMTLCMCLWMHAYMCINMYMASCIYACIYVLICFETRSQVYPRLDLTFLLIDGAAFIFLTLKEQMELATLEGNCSQNPYQYCKISLWVSPENIQVCPRECTMHCCHCRTLDVTSRVR